MFGPAIIQAYRSESLAPPFGVAVHESARAFFQLGEEPFRMSHWLWWAPNEPVDYPTNAAPLPTLKACLASDLEDHFRLDGGNFDLPRHRSCQAFGLAHPVRAVLRGGLRRRLEYAAPTPVVWAAPRQKRSFGSRRISDVSFWCRGSQLGRFRRSQGCFGLPNPPRLRPLPKLYIPRHDWADTNGCRGTCPPLLRVRFRNGRK